jgi:hypothetical protein
LSKHEEWREIQLERALKGNECIVLRRNFLHFSTIEYDEKHKFDEREGHIGALKDLQNEPKAKSKQKEIWKVRETDNTCKPLSPRVTIVATIYSRASFKVCQER